jgi:hypothetical protein
MFLFLIESTAVLHHKILINGEFRRILFLYSLILHKIIIMKKNKSLCICYRDDSRKSGTNGDGLSLGTPGYWDGIYTAGPSWFNWGNIYFASSH